MNCAQANLSIKSGAIFAAVVVAQGPEGAARADELPSFTTRFEISSVFEDPDFVEIVDFNLDGIQDAVASSDGGIRVFLGDGSAVPAFSEFAFAPTVGGRQSFVVVDIDGDSDLDIASTATIGTQSGSVWVHWNNGDSPPSFQTDTLKSGHSFLSICVADLNGDHALDLIVASASDDSVRVFLQDPMDLQTFSSIVATDAYFEAGSVDAGDFDGDGDMDIIVGGFDVLRWLKNVDGSATEFELIDVFSAPPGTSDRMAATVLDIDDDLRPDVLTTWAGDGAIRIHRNLGGTPVAFETTQIGTAPHVWSAAVLDVDQDGLKDIATASRDDDTVRVWRRQSAESNMFAEERVSTSADDVRSVAIGDIDGDGDDDIASASLLDDSIRWYRNDHSIQERIAFRSEAVIDQLAHPTSTTTADFDNDGRIDVVSVDIFTGLVRLAMNQGGDPPLWDHMAIPQGASQPTQVLSADLNGDSLSDLVVRESGLTWRKNEGGDPPAFQKLTISTDHHGFVTVGDLDGDLDIDVIASDGPEIRVFVNDGAQDPTFGVQAIYTASSNIRSITTGDYDDDGDLDFVATWSSNLQLFENTSTNEIEFQPHLIDDLADFGINCLVSGDFDDDNDIDLAAGTTDGAVVLYENLSITPFEFAPRLINSADGQQRNVQFMMAMDIDRDGRLDILSAHEGGDVVRWHRSTPMSPNGFETHIVSHEYESRSLSAGDINGDGQIDIIGAMDFSDVSDEVQWFENLFRLRADLNDDGNVNGADLASLLSGWGPDSGFGADLNGDGLVNGADLAILLATWTVAK